MHHKPMFRMATLLLGLAAAQSQAGGLWVGEYNQPTMGRAGAGEETGSGDATDAFFNAASMSQHEESQFMAAVGGIWATAEFDVDSGSIVNGTGDGGDAGGGTPSASVFWSRPLNDRWSIGMSGAALTGAVLDYDNDWVGRFETTEVSVLVIGFIPAVSYKVSDKLSLGLSVPMMYSELELDIAVPAAISPTEGEGKLSLDGDDMQAAVTGSFLYQFNDKTRLGARVSSNFQFDYDGDIKTAQGLGVGASTEITFSSIARVGLTHDFNEQWSGHVTWGWDNWSEMGDVLLSTDSKGVTLSRNWQDTYHYAIGADYRLDKRWTLRAGMAYDTSPTDEHDRTADMPMDEQYRFAIGADYLRDSGMRVSGSLVYADYGDAEIDNSANQPVLGFAGDYGTNEIWFASLSFNWPMGVTR